MDKLKTTAATVLGAVGIVAALWLVPGFLPENRSEANVPRGAPPPLPVVIEPVTYDTELLELEAIGTSQALRSVVLFPEAAGEVVAVRFEAGQEVVPGDLLLELDSRDERLAVQLAEVRVADASRLAERYSRAKGSDAVPINEVEAAQLALATAEIELERARIALDDRFVRAPFGGVLGLTDIEPGDRIDPSVAIATIDDRTSLLVTFEVPELMLGAVTKGEQVEVGTWNQRGTVALGEVVDIGSRIDPVTRTVAARARVSNVDDALRPGMSFRVKLRIEGDRYPVVPEVAVQWGANGAYVWTLVDGKALRMPADIVQRRDGRVLLDSAIEENAPVVVEGIQSVREGREVKIRSFDS